MAIDAKTEADLRDWFRAFIAQWGPLDDDACDDDWEWVSRDEMADHLMDVLDKARDFLRRMGDADGEVRP